MSSKRARRLRKPDILDDSNALVVKRKLPYGR
jgi:ribosomal protein L35